MSERCLLVQGFTGKLCESRDCEPGTPGCVDDVTCQSNPCMNGASCVCRDDESACHCECLPMFYGDVCQYQLQQPPTPSPSERRCDVNNCPQKAGNGRCDVSSYSLLFLLRITTLNFFSFYFLRIQLHLLRFVVNLFYNVLYNRSTTSCRTSP